MVVEVPSSAPIDNFATFVSDGRRPSRAKFFTKEFVSMKLKDKNIIVTGASSGIGRAFSRALVEKGARVYGLARNAEALGEVKEQLGFGFVPIAMDLTQGARVRDWVNETFTDGELPDGLINNAGAGYFAKVEELLEERWHTMMDTNVNGMYYLTSAVVPLMKRNPDHCHILNIGSILAQVGSPERSGYCASKFAIRGFSESLAKELRFDKIKVTCFNPGSIDTDFFAESGVEAHSRMLQPADLANTVVHILETPDNFLVDEITIRPLNPRAPG